MEGLGTSGGSFLMALRSDMRRSKLGRRGRRGGHHNERKPQDEPRLLRKNQTQPRSVPCFLFDQRGELEEKLLASETISIPFFANWFLASRFTVSRTRKLHEVSRTRGTHTYIVAWREPCETVGNSEWVKVSYYMDVFLFFFFFYFLFLPNKKKNATKLWSSTRVSSYNKNKEKWRAFFH